MKLEADSDLIEKSETTRQLLSEEFFSYREYVEYMFSQNLLPETILSRDISSDQVDSGQLARAVLEELYVLLCTNDKRYQDVRTQGGAFVKVALPALSAYIAGVMGIDIGIATGAVAFMALTVLKIGTNSFCRVMSSAKKSLS